MHRGMRAGAMALALGLLTSGCFGPFNLTRRLYHWNQQVQGEWEREIIFVVLVVVPAYGFAGLADAVVFNSLEFWGKENPVEPPTAGLDAVPQTKRIVRGEDEALLTYARTAEGAELRIAQFRRGEPVGSLRITRDADTAVGFDANGKVLVTARSLADGGMLVSDAQGRQVASYTADQVQQVLR